MAESVLQNVIPEWLKELLLLGPQPAAGAAVGELAAAARESRIIVGAVSFFCCCVCCIFVSDIIGTLVYSTLAYPRSGKPLAEPFL